MNNTANQHLVHVWICLCKSPYANNMTMLIIRFKSYLYILPHHTEHCISSHLTTTVTVCAVCNILLQFNISALLTSIFRKIRIFTQLDCWQFFFHSVRLNTKTLFLLFHVSLCQYANIIFLSQCCALTWLYLKNMNNSHQRWSNPAQAINQKGSMSTDTVYRTIPPLLLNH